MYQVASSRRGLRPEQDDRVAGRSVPWVLGSLMLVAIFGRLLNVSLHPRARPMGDWSIEQIKRAVFGRSARHVRARLGPPSAVTQIPANTWYYRLEGRERKLMAITFELGRARRVELVRSLV